MSVRNIGSNQTEVETKKGRILVSYSTPVAAWINGRAYRTDKKWSKTTSKHINAWLADAKAEEKPQSFFDNLL